MTGFTLQWALLLAGVTALHAAWQAVLAAGLFSVVIGARPRSSPELRHSVGLTLLLALPLLAAGTVVSMLLAPAAQPTADNVMRGGDAPALLTPVLPWIGGLWCMVSLAGMGRLARAIVTARRLARLGSPAPVDLVARVERQGWRLGLSDPPRVRLSDHARSPSVVDVFGPTVLIPSRLLATLSDDELDAILAHELAHVRRRDLIASVAQEIALALLAFHPAARWMSRVIDEARERCCDDLATTARTRRRYARALTKVALEVGRPSIASPGAGGGDVVARVRRLQRPATTRAATHGTLRGLTLALAIILVHTVATSRSIEPTARAVTASSVWQSHILAADGASFTVDATDPAGSFVLSVDRGRAVGATIAGAPLSRDQIRQRGARVTLVAPDPERTVRLMLLPGGEIRWPARPPVPTADTQR